MLLLRTIFAIIIVFFLSLSLCTHKKNMISVYLCASFNTTLVMFHIVCFLCVCVAPLFLSHPRGHLYFGQNHRFIPAIVMHRIRYELLAALFIFVNYFCLPLLCTGDNLTIYTAPQSSKLMSVCVLSM